MTSRSPRHELRNMLVPGAALLLPGVVAFVNLGFARDDHRGRHRIEPLAGR